jgi:23S rRNA pseudouridine2605 synthase/23S rRNA pseudouridine2604 synthase
MLERLQKILSARGIASRRKAEEYITQGLVKVNGVVATLGQKADPHTDKIEVDGKVLQARQDMLYYVMHKPVGVVTTNARGTTQKTVSDLVPQKLRSLVFPVGRLDMDSEGLLLFTNDGVLAYRLTHPKFDHEKEYEVTLDRAISGVHCRQLEEGFLLDGSMTKPLRTTKVAPNRIRIILTEGRNRQIRRMCQHAGYTVKHLRRVRIMTLEDTSMHPGAMRPLTDSEREALLRSMGIDGKQKSPDEQEKFGYDRQE